MPYKNKDKILKEDMYYHVYNRGHSKQPVFINEHDYFAFIYLLKKYLDPDFRIIVHKANGRIVFKIPNHLYDEVELIAYCLMPNHYHLLLKQTTRSGMTKLMSRVTASYTIYFNKKYTSSNSIWGGTYRAVCIFNEKQLMDVICYIHTNPTEITKELSIYPYSSLPLYQGATTVNWVHPALDMETHVSILEDYLSRRGSPDMHVV